MEMNKWLKLKKGDTVKTRGGQIRKIITIKETKDYGKCIELDSGSVYCTGDRILFV